MKKKILTALVIITVLLLSILIVGCSGVKTGKDYYLYTYDNSQGQFIKNQSKVVFEKNEYCIYDNNGQVVNLGVHSTNNNILSLIPDKLGSAANQIAATTSMYVSGEYLIDAAVAFSRLGETKFEDRTDLEGIYDSGIKLSGGKIYESLDGSDIDVSFTSHIGDYQINKNKDFITFDLKSGMIMFLLRFEYKDAFGYSVTGLATSFYSYKTPKTDNIVVSDIELAEKVFINKSPKGGSANYALSLLSYPNKTTVTQGVTYSIVGVNNNASILGSDLSYNGVGSVMIECKYGNKTLRETVYIVDLEIKSNIVDDDRTYNVGDVVDFDDILSDITDYSSFFFAFESVAISDSAKAEVNKGSVEFKAAGTVQATLKVRYVIPYKDGTNQVVEKDITTNIIIK